MRILFCNYEYPPLGGGGGVANAALAEELAKRHAVTVLSSQAMGLPSTSDVNSVRILRVPVLFRRHNAIANLPSMLAYLPSAIRKGRHLLRSEPFDIINTHFVVPSGPVGHYLANFAGIPNVLSIHGGDLYDPSKRLSPHRHPLLRIWIRHLLRNADCVVAQSRNTQMNMQTIYAPELQAIRIPLGIQRHTEVNARRAEFGFADNHRILITVGRLVSRKAMAQLIDIIRSLHDPSVHLIIVGSGPREDALRQRAVAAGVSPNIHFMGHTDEATKFKLLAIADIFVSTSQHEGFGLVYLEAMAAGLPIVCYDNGGQTDFLQEPRTGGLIPLNNQERFLRMVRGLLSNPEHRASIRAENRRRVEAFFIDSCAAQYEQLFRNLMDGSSRTTAQSAASRLS